MSNHGDYAKEILVHYLTMTMREVGLNVDGDTGAEIVGAVDDIIGPMTKRLDEQDRRIETLERNVKALVTTARRDEDFEDWKTERTSDKQEAG